MAGEKYYTKKGKKYFPVNDPYAYDGLGKGAWLVTVGQGCIATRRALHPKFVEIEAGLRYLEDGMCKAMLLKCELGSRDRIISDKEKKAWAKFRKIMGSDMPSMFSYPSLQDVAQSGCEYIKKVMEENDFDLEKIREKFEVKKRQIANPILDLEME